MHYHQPHSIPAKEHIFMFEGKMIRNALCEFTIYTDRCHEVLFYIFFIFFFSFDGSMMITTKRTELKQPIDRPKPLRGFRAETCQKVPIFSAIFH